MAAQTAPLEEPVLQLCSEYSNAGDQVKASVSAHGLSISIARSSGQTLELHGTVSDVASTSLPTKLATPCHIAISTSSDRAALSIMTAKGVVIQFFSLSKGELGPTVNVPPKFPIQFSLHPVGFINRSDQLEVSQAHYLPTGEPEVSTQLVEVDGTIIPDAHSVLGPKYAEVTGSSFDFRAGRVWFLCPVYAARNDRQPRCALTSAALTGTASSAFETIPPPPDDRVVGSGQPNLGFPSSDLVVLLAQDRLWLYSFSTGIFREMTLPETPHHIRWFEFPGNPKFSSDGRFAAVPVFMSHAPLFEEGSISHGTKILVVDLKTLQILRTFQPDRQAGVIDFALNHRGSDVTLIANWGDAWKTFVIPVADGN